MQWDRDGDTATLAEAEEVDLVWAILELVDQRRRDDVVGDEFDGDGQGAHVQVQVSGASVDVQILRPLRPGQAERERQWEGRIECDGQCIRQVKRPRERREVGCVVA